MPKPSHADVESRVFTAVASRAGLSLAATRKLAAAGTDNLTKDLGIPSNALGGLNNDLTYIALRYDDGIKVPVAAFNKAKTATACVELTYSCACGTAP